MVGFCRHDEVILVETADLMSPPGHGDAPPLGQQRRVMALFFGQCAYGVREGERIDEIRKDEVSLEALNSVSLHERPIGDLLVQRSTLLCRDSGGPALAGLTFHLCQFAHVKPAPGLVEARYDP